MNDDAESNESPFTTIPVGVVMLLTELLFELQDADPALGRRLISRFKGLEGGAMAKSNPSAMELVRLVAKEMEDRNGE